MTEKRNYYAVLGVYTGATEREIKCAYRQLALRYHPDHNPNDPAASDIFNHITTAYTVLSDPRQRAAYDQRAAAAATFDRRAIPRDGPDVRYSVSITFGEARTGTRRVAQFHAPDGQPRPIMIDIPPGTRNGAHIRIAGAGSPGLHGGKAGDMIVVVVIEDR